MADNTSYLTNTISVKKLGAVGNGIHDDTRAFNKAIIKANAQSSSLGGNGTKGATIFIPDGDYNIPNGLHEKIQTDNITIVGESSSGAIIRVQKGHVFVWEHPKHMLVGGGIRSLKFVSNQKSGTAVLIKVVSGARMNFVDLQLRNIYRLAILGVNKKKLAGSIYFSEIFGYVRNAAQAVIEAKYGSGLYINNVSLYPNFVGVPNERKLHSVKIGTDFLNLVSGSWDTIVLSNIITLRFYRNIYVVVAKNVIISNLYATNCIFDTGAKSSVELIGKGGNATKYNFTNCWFVAMDGSGVDISGDKGLLEHFHFHNCVSLLSGKHGFSFDGKAIKKVSVNQCQSIAQGRLEEKKSYGIYVNIPEIEIIGGSHGLNGKNHFRSPKLWANYGVCVTSRCIKHRIIGVEADGDSNKKGCGGDGFLISTFKKTSSSRVIMGNICANGDKPSYAKIQTIPTPVSGKETVNMKSMTVILYIRDGIITTVKKNGITVFTTTNVTIELSPGDRYILIYIIPPVVIEDIKP